MNMFIRVFTNEMEARTHHAANCSNELKSIYFETTKRPTFVPTEGARRFEGSAGPIWYVVCEDFDDSVGC